MGPRIRHQDSSLNPVYPSLCYFLFGYEVVTIRRNDVSVICTFKTSSYVRLILSSPHFEDTVCTVSEDLQGRIVAWSVAWFLVPGPREMISPQRPMRSLLTRLSIADGHDPSRKSSIHRGRDRSACSPMDQRLSETPQAVADWPGLCHAGTVARKPEETLRCDSTPHALTCTSWHPFITPLTLQ